MSSIAELATAGRIEPARLPAADPDAAPGKPPVAWKRFGGKALVVTYETDLDAVLELLPPELTPMTDPPQVVCLLSDRYELAVGGGAHGEMAPLIPVLWRGEPHLYAWVAYLGEGSEEALAPERELLAHRKKTAAIELRQDRGRGLLLGTVERPAGYRLVTQLVGPLERQGDESTFVQYPRLALQGPILRAGDETPSTQLVRRRISASIRRASDGTPMIFTGTATLEIARSEQDPLYLLPVRKLLSGVYVEFGTVAEHTSEVLHRYA
jgi:acetoacetate decarboxylase